MRIKSAAIGASPWSRSFSEPCPRLSPADAADASSRKRAVDRQ